MKKIMILLIMLMTLFLVSCTQQVVCNKPYILVGTECCLDQNDNLICDKDEVVKTSTGVVETGKEIEVKTYTMSDLQADIGNVVLSAESEFIILEKGKETDGLTFYIFQTSKASRLGKDMFLDFVPFRSVVVSVSDNDLQVGEPFFNFIEEHSDYLTEQLEWNKEEFIKEFSEGTEYERIKEEWNKGAKQWTIGDYINYSSEEEILVDDFKLLETVANKIITRDYVSLENYKFNYVNSISGIEREIKAVGLNYLQSVSVFCTPEITITIFYKTVPMAFELEKNSLNSFYKQRKAELTADAQALVSMCEDRYDFEYLRVR